MTHASALAPVPFPQLSPPVRHYHPTLPSPCALGQQVTALLSRALLSCLSYCLAALLSDVASSYAIVQTVYCLIDYYCLPALLL